MDINEFKNECRNAPRLNNLSKFFLSTASGTNGMPLLGEHTADTSLFLHDANVNLFYKFHKNLRGYFDKHFFASIPYVLEEECRMGSALLNYGISKAYKKNIPTRIYTLGTAEATMARTIAKLADGKIKTFSCSPTEENRTSFFLYGIPQHAKFFVGPFCDVDYTLFNSNSEYYDFKNGFDIIVEDTTFQMYSNNRYEQISFVKDKLVDDGIFIFVEKFRNKSAEEYMKREKQKDKLFKSRYFSPEQIELKKRDVLSVMNNFEVSLLDFCKSLKRIFKNAVIVWNSGNFYTILASNSQESLTELISNLIPPCIPSIFCYEQLPKVLFGLDEVRLEFRNPIKLLDKKSSLSEYINTNECLGVVK